MSGFNILVYDRFSHNSAVIYTEARDQQTRDLFKQILRDDGCAMMQGKMKEYENHRQFMKMGKEEVKVTKIHLTSEDSDIYCTVITEKKQYLLKLVDYNYWVSVEIFPGDFKNVPTFADGMYNGQIIQIWKEVAGGVSETGLELYDLQVGSDCF